jgi:subtilisin family serine protease
MHRRPRDRRLRTCVESLESRRLLAAVPIKIIDGAPVATVEWQGQPVEMFAGRWMVQLDGYDGNLLAQEARAQQTIGAVSRGFSVVRHMAADGMFLVQAPEQMQPADVVATLGAVPGFRAIGPDIRYELLGMPNDSSFGTMWGMHNTGQSGGVVDADIDAPEAWDLATGSADIVVGMVDSGIDYNHPDLNDNVWINTLEIDGNGIDDDANGFIDDVRGWDWWGNLSTPGVGDNNPADQSGHGTHTAGTVGAEGNNAQGVTGVNWDVTLIALKIGGPGSAVSGAAAVSAMNYMLALENRANQPVNVKVSNHSWGGGGFDGFMNNAIAAHANAGILTVCAAGNNGSNNDSFPFYPASYNQPNNISVGNHTRSDVRNSGSNFGATSVDLFAPGTQILSTVPGGGYSSAFTGTSMAAPHVAGTAALMYALVPSASYTAVRDAIFQSVDQLPAYSGICVTGGRLNAAAALNRIGLIPAAPAQPDLDSSSDLGQFDNDNLTSDNTPTFTGSGATAGNTILIFANGAQVGSGTVAAGGTWSVTTNPITDGIKSITARQSNGSGSSGDSPALTMTIDTLAPTVSATLFAYFQSPNWVRFSFSENVGWSIGADDFDVENLTTPGSLAVTPTYDAVLNAVRLTFNGLPILPDANFRATILASGPGNGVRDVAGNAVATFAHDFFYLRGDANRDARVNLDDFNILAANFGQNFREWEQGDFTYDNVVNLDDFNLLAARFGTVLAAPSAAPSAFGQTRLGQTDKDDVIDDLLA